MSSTPTVNMSTVAESVIGRVAAGEDPHKVVEEVLKEGVSGPDRRDIDYAEKEAMFGDLIAQSEAEVPYLNHDYVDQVLGQIRQGAPAEELIALSAKNRDDALASGHNLGEEDFGSWDAIHRALVATYTDQLPPTQAG